MRIAKAGPGTIEALNPLGRQPELLLQPLSPRPAGLEGRVIYAVNSWREGSGMEGVLDRIGAALQDRHPGLRIVRVDKPSPFLTDDPELWDEMVQKADAFIYAAAPSCSTTAWAVTWAAGLERRGLPGVVLSFETLLEDAEGAAERQGVPLRVVSVPYPPEAITGEEWEEIADLTDRALTNPPLGEEARTGPSPAPRPERIAFRGGHDDCLDFFYNQGWTDGLPIVPPTEERLAAMLKGTGHAPEEVVTATMWPEAWEATVEKVALNGVMAGCRPEHLPVLLAAVEAFGQEDISAQVRSTNSFCFMQVVNGPIRNEIGMNAGTSALSPGNRANAAIGRALRLFVLNLGGGRVGLNLMANLGNVGLYSFCLPENEEESPWEPLSVDLGYRAGESVLTIFSGGWFHAGNFISQPLEELARTMAWTEHPTGMVALMAPPRARSLAEQKMTKARVREVLWREAKRTIAEFRANPWYKVFIEPSLEGKVLDGKVDIWPREYLTMARDEVVPVFPRTGVQVVVVGGQASPMMQGWHMERPLSASIDKWR